MVPLVAGGGFAVLAALALLLAACAADDPGRVPATTPRSPDPLPADVFLELAFPERGIRHRFTTDGRYLVVPGEGERERGGEVRSQREGDRTDVSAAARERLLAAVREAELFDLPPQLPQVEPTGIPPNTPPGSRPRREPVVIRARDGDRTASVTISADPGWPQTLGPLRPVVAAMDVEAIGWYIDE